MREKTSWPSMEYVTATCRVVNSPEISGNISKSLEIIMSVISYEFTDVPGSRVKNSFFCERGA